MSLEDIKNPLGRRVIYAYQIPLKLQVLTDQRLLTEIKMVELTAQEELQAEQMASAAGGSRSRILVETIKASLQDCNLGKLSTADGSADRLFAVMPPKLRSLITRGFLSLHSTTSEEDQLFLDSVTASVAD